MPQLASVREEEKNQTMNTDKSRDDETLINQNSTTTLTREFGRVIRRISTLERTDKRLTFDRPPTPPSRNGSETGEGFLDFPGPASAGNEYVVSAAKSFSDSRSNSKSKDSS